CLLYDEAGEAVVASIQSKIENAKPWDEFLFGKKSQNEDLLLTHLAALSNSAKIYISLIVFFGMLVGNERLHTGQFMTFFEGPEDVKEKNTWQQVTGFIGIDFGARECFSLNRLEKNDFKFKSSEIYAKFGQFNKDYLSYLLKNPDIRQYVYALWNKLNKYEIANIQQEAILSFREQLACIPEKLQSEALNKVYDIYAKNSSYKRNPKKNIIQKDLEKIISDVIYKRVTQMREIAKK